MNMEEIYENRLAEAWKRARIEVAANEATKLSSDAMLERIEEAFRKEWPDRGEPLISFQDKGHFVIFRVISTDPRVDEQTIVVSK